MNLSEQELKFIEENGGMFNYVNTIFKMRDDDFEKIINFLVEKTGKRLREIELEHLKNLAFIKEVLFQNRLTSEKQYAHYVAEWERLNQAHIKESLE